MRFSKAPSWRFAESMDQLLLLALYTRDMAGLSPASDPAQPPPLTGMDSEPRLDLAEDDRDLAGRQWIGWWDDLLDNAILTHSGDGPTGRAAWERTQQIVDPPEFSALADRPALRKAMLATYSKGVRWTDAATSYPASPAVPYSQKQFFPWLTVKAAAEEAAFDQGVSIDTMRGVVLVLAVEGVWWHRHTPGAVLCSSEAAQNPAVARRVLREAFTPV
jgi:hypothetical protein